MTECLDQFIDWVRSKATSPPPENAHLLLHDRDNAMQVTDRLDVADLLRLLDATTIYHPNAAIVLRLTEVMVNRLLKEEDYNAIHRIFEYSITGADEVGIVGSRINFIGMIHHTLVHQHAKVTDILAPAIRYMTDNSNTFILQLSWLIVAAHYAGDSAIVASAAEAIGDDPTRVPPARPEAAAIARRVLLLRRLGIDTCAPVDEWPEWNKSARQTALYLDRRSMLEAIGHLQQLDIGPAADPSLFIAAIGSVARTNRWAQVYRAAQQLAESALHKGCLFDVMLDAWINAGLPGATLALAQRRATAPTDSESVRPQHEFLQVPSLSLAQHIWHGAAVRGDTEAVLLYATIEPDEIESARLSLAMRDAPAKVAPFWIFMTWHESSHRLLSNLANMLPPEGRVVVSIGGSGHPAQLSLATAAMLVPGVYLMNRAPLAWGGPRLLFENALAVMRLFRVHAPADAWFQIVCDRSFPLHSMEDITELFHDPRQVANLQGVTVSAWEGEFEPEQLADLPNLIRRSIDHIFETVDPGTLLTIAGALPDWRGLSADHRLNSLLFNFSSEARSTTDNPRVADNVYAVSPFDADMKWMSHTRLHSFVDVSAENNTTYIRRMPEMMSSWVYKALRPLNLRHGEPFLVCNQHYIGSMFDSANFSEVASAMHLSFGPEMNFFDTMASALQIEQHLFHCHAHIAPGGIDQRHAAEAAISADVLKRTFVRKVDAIKSDPVVAPLARDACFAGEWRNSYWASLSRENHAFDIEPGFGIDVCFVTLLLNRDFVIRDMLSRFKSHARLEQGGTIISLEGFQLGLWSHDDDTLKIDLSDGSSKRYRSYTASLDRLILVPDELVGVYNRWGQFLDFPLNAIDDTSDGLRIEAPDVGVEGSWHASDKRNIAFLAALAKGEGNVPMPAIEREGRLQAIRQVDGVWLALATIDRFPALLRIIGAARAGGRDVHIYEKAHIADLRLWEAGKPAAPFWSLGRDTIGGEWELETLDVRRRFTFLDDNRIFDGDQCQGRWTLHEQGLRIWGVEGVRVGLATEFLYASSGSWRLAGWGQQMLGQPVSFSLTKKAPPLH